MPVMDFLAHHKCLVRKLLDQGFRYGLLCRKSIQFYRSHHSLVQRYSHSLTQHLREVMIVRFGDGASAFCWLAQRWLAPTDYQFTLSLVSPWHFPPSFFFISVLLIFKLFIDFSSSFFLSFFKFYFIFFYFIAIFYSLSLLFNSLSSEYARSCNVYR